VTKPKTTATRGQKSRSSRTPPYSTLLSTADKIKTLFEMVCAPFDITGQQYNVLRILRSAEPHGLPTLTIAERVIEKTPGMTRMIDRLESKGLVTREIRPHDRRCVYCRITKKGLKLLKLLDEPVEAFNKRAFRGLSAKELEQLVALLLKAREAHQHD
jgi:DNA-binding MarR family transcriptional regulator